LDILLSREATTENTLDEVKIPGAPFNSVEELEELNAKLSGDETFKTSMVVLF
jgi:hypothetical protein